MAMAYHVQRYRDQHFNLKCPEQHDYKNSASPYADEGRGNEDQQKTYKGKLRKQGEMMGGV